MPFHSRSSFDKEKATVEKEMKKLHVDVNLANQGHRLLQGDGSVVMATLASYSSILHLHLPFVRAVICVIAEINLFIECPFVGIV